MGTIIKGMKLLSALVFPDKRQKRIMQLAAKAHSIDNAYELNKGELVKINHLLGIVVRPKTKEHCGLAAVVNASKCRWYTVLTYCPYLNELGYDGSCGLVTKACSMEDGKSNTEMIKQLKTELEKKDINRSIALPPADRHYFPAFDSYRLTEKNGYLPAINELQLLTDEKELFLLYVQLEKGLHGVDMTDEQGKCLLWSSTDAQKSYSDDDCHERYYSDAFAIDTDTEGLSSVLTVRKTEDAWVIPYCRF